MDTEQPEEATTVDNSDGSDNGENLNPQRSSTLDFGLWVSMLGLVVAALTLIFGRGFFLNSFSQTQVKYETDQIPMEMQTISSCIVTNNGNSNATEVRVQFKSDANNPFIRDVEIMGAEGLGVIEAGKIGESHALVSAKRLANDDPLRITIATEDQGPVTCQVITASGTVRSANPIFNLAWADFLIIIGWNTLLWVAVIVLVNSLVKRRFNGRNPQDGA